MKFELPETTFGTLTPENGDAHGKRLIVKSAIPFPYVNLEDVAALAKGMSNRGGVPLARDQLADAINTVENSTFSLKIAAARMFDVIVLFEGKFSLTKIGHSLASDDDDEAKTARRDAFWSVELYRKVYEHFRGKTLPPRAGIENALVSLGVSEKQAEKARQAFERSAQFAGYLSANKDRLVQPVIITKNMLLDEPLNPLFNTPKEHQNKDDRTKNRIDLENFDDPLQEPLVTGLLKRLPPIGSEWPAKERVKWIRTLIANFTTIYSEGSDEHAISVILKNLNEPA